MGRVIEVQFGKQSGGRKANSEQEGPVTSARVINIPNPFSPESGRRVEPQINALYVNIYRDLVIVANKLQEMEVGIDDFNEIVAYLRELVTEDFEIGTLIWQYAQVYGLPTSEVPPAIKKLDKLMADCSVCLRDPLIEKVLNIWAKSIPDIDFV